MKIKSIIFIIMFLSAILSGYFFIRIKYFYLLITFFALVGIFFFLIKRVYYHYMFIMVTILFLVSCFLVNSFNTDLYIKIFLIICFIMLGCFLYYWNKTDISEVIYKNLLYVGLLISLLGIYEYFLNDLIFKKYIASSYLVFMSDIAYESYRIRTFFNHPIIYGNFLVVLFCINLSVNKNRFFYNVLNLLIISNLVMTQSRSSWISLLIIFTIYTVRLKVLKLKNDRLRKKIFNPYLKFSISIFSLILLVPLFLLYSSFFESVYNQILNRIFDVQTSYGSISYLQRTFAITAITNEVFLNSIFPELLFGHGLGSSDAFMSIQTFSFLKGFSTTDNTYLDILYDFGLIGFISYILLIIYLTINFFGRKVSNFYLCNYLIFLSIAINSFFYSILGWDIILFFFVLSIMFMLLEKQNLNLEQGVKNYAKILR